MFIFLDESGDLGFDFENKNPSNHFVITLLVCENKESVTTFKTAVTRTLKNKLNHKKSTRRVHELHATSTSLDIKEYFYRQIKNKQWAIYTVALNKHRAYPNLRTKTGKKKLYNYLSNFLIQKVQFKNNLTTVDLVVDKCKNKAEIEDFNQYLNNQLEANLPLNVNVNFRHMDSKASHGLQAVDSFCWGVWRKYEHEDETWYSYFKDQIRFETRYFDE